MTNDSDSQEQKPERGNRAAQVIIVIVLAALLLSRFWLMFERNSKESGTPAAIATTAAELAAGLGFAALIYGALGMGRLLAERRDRAIEESSRGDLVVSGARNNNSRRGFFGTFRQDEVPQQVRLPYWFTLVADSSSMSFVAGSSPYTPKLTLRWADITSIEPTDFPSGVFTLRGLRITAEVAGVPSVVDVVSIGHGLAHLFPQPRVEWAETVDSLKRMHSSYARR